MFLVERRAPRPATTMLYPSTSPSASLGASATQGQARETPAAPVPNGQCPLVTCSTFKVCPIVAIKQRGYVGTVSQQSLASSAIAEFSIRAVPRLVSPQARPFQGGGYEVHDSPARTARDRSRARAFCRTSRLPGRLRPRRRNDQGNREVAGSLASLGGLRT